MYLPCKDPNCPSYGKPHPNCRCFADGGCVEGYTHARDCEYYADGGELTTPDMAVHHAAVGHGLHGLMTKVGKPGEPGDSVRDLYDDAKRGHKTLQKHAKAVFAPGKMDVENNTDKLHGLLDTLHQDPNSMANMGGDIGATHSEHAGVLAATAATATQYLQSIKPQPIQVAPLDPVFPPTKTEMAVYNRQVRVAQHPLSVLAEAKTGMIQDADVTTLRVVYPRLYESMQQSIMEELAAHGVAGGTLTYRQKQGLSTLLGQPLDSTLTPSAMQAIMAAQGPQQAQQQAKAGPGASKPSAADLNAIEKDDTLSETPQEARLAKRKE